MIHLVDEKTLIYGFTLGRIKLDKLRRNWNLVVISTPTKIIILNWSQNYSINLIDKLST